MFALFNSRRLRRRTFGRYRYVRWRWRILFAAVDGVGAALFGLVRVLRRRFQRLFRAKKRVPAEESDNPNRILLIQLDHLGDAVISTVMLPVLKARYPAASIEVLAGAPNRELFEVMPQVKRVHVSRWNRFGRGRRLGWIAATAWWGLRLRRHKIDLAIDVRGEFPHAVMMWLCGARRRLGWDCGGGGFLLTDTPRFVSDRPEVESRLALLAELGIRPTGAEAPWRPAFRPSRLSKRHAARLFDELSPNGPTGGPRFVLHVGAGTRAKQWSPEHWRELIGRLVVRQRAQVVLVGSRRDRIISEQILGPLPPDGVADWTGRLRIAELAAVFEQADLVVGADSGPAHLAAAVGTPVVVLFSGTNNPRQWRPCGEHVCVVRHPVECSPCHRRDCPRPDHPCMNGLTPQRVAEAVEEFYRRPACRPPDRRPPVDRFAEAGWCHEIEVP